MPLCLPARSLAQAYGDGAYGSGVYNGSLPATTPTPTAALPITVPTSAPITITTPIGALPITGATLTFGASISLLLIALGLYRWARQRHANSAK